MKKKEKKRAIKKNREYKIKAKGDYFQEKYNNPTPKIVIEDTDINVFGEHWMLKAQEGNPACFCFAKRVIGLNDGEYISKNVYYGKVGNIGELVFDFELEEI